MNGGLHGTGLVADDLYLLAHDDQSGRPLLKPRPLGIGLVGGLLAELMLGGSIGLRRGGTVVLSDTRPGEDLALQVRRQIGAEREFHTLREWLLFLACGAEEDVAGRLERTGYLMRVPCWVPGRPGRWVPVDPDWAFASLLRVRCALNPARPFAAREAALTGLAVACGLGFRLDRYQLPASISVEEAVRAGSKRATDGCVNQPRGWLRYVVQVGDSLHRALQPAARRLAKAVPDRVVRIGVNLAGAAGAAWFARVSLLYYLHTHRLIGGVFCIEQAWFVAAFLIRRPPQAVSRDLGSWLLAAGGTFGGLLLRPGGIHLGWGVRSGLILQLVGLALAITALLALGRSFGFVAADRGLVTRGPYAVVRHPVYAAYLLIQSGYLLQSLSWRNAAVLLLASGCNIGRVMAEERLLAAAADPAGYGAYQQRVRWRLAPGLW